MADAEHSPDRSEGHAKRKTNLIVCKHPERYRDLHTKLNCMAAVDSRILKLGIGMGVKLLKFEVCGLWFEV